MSDNPFESLMATMSTLRGVNGCPWDREQSLETLKSYLIEEAYEVIDAIDGGRSQEHLEELGDLLFQIVFQSQIRSEMNDFTLLDVARAIDEKMQRRHRALHRLAQAWLEVGAGRRIPIPECLG